MEKTKTTQTDGQQQRGDMWLPEDALSLLTELLRMGRGGVEMGLTESGEIGAWYAGEEDASGTGATAEEALRDMLE